MGFGINEVAYAPEERRRNQLVISAMAVGAILLVLLVPTYTDWPFKNALGISGLLVLFFAGQYWMFASKKAGKLEAPTGWNRWREHMNL